jgi:hypothetical protein
MLYLDYIGIIRLLGTTNLSFALLNELETGVCTTLVSLNELVAPTKSGY